MKKFITIIFATIVAMVSLASCSKMETPTEYATVTFGYQMVESNSMVATKAFTNKDIVDVITSALPTTMTMTLKDNDTKLTYTMKIGEPITLPLGTYSVSYEHPAYSRTTTTPTFNIKDNCIEITKSTTSYTLNAEYTCFAVVVDLTEISTLYYGTSSGNKPNIIKKGEMGVIFVPSIVRESSTLSYSYTSISFTLVADAESSFETTTIYFNSTYEKGKVLYEYGKYYIIHPNTVDKASTSFGVSFPEWEEGEL